MKVYFDVHEAQSLLHDYQSALPRCRSGSLLKEEFTKLNLRMFSLGMTFPPDSALESKFEDVMTATSERRSQYGIFAHMDEDENIRRWINFLTGLLDDTAVETLAETKVKPPPLI